MDSQVSLKKILKMGFLTSELDLERATMLDRRLRLMLKEFPELAEDRKKLQEIIIAYEQKHWVEQEITEEKVVESDLAGQIAEKERVFLHHRKNLIKSTLKELGLTQKELGAILGHSSASYISELICGVSPFTLNDLVVMHRLLGIELQYLIPTTLTKQVTVRILDIISKLNNPKLKTENLMFAWQA